LHAVKLVAQLIPHLPVPHTALPLDGGGAQVVPHTPQLAMSLVTSTQLLPHWVKLGSQLTWQTPTTQLAVP
jgi:hypothetical protein